MVCSASPIGCLGEYLYCISRNPLQRKHLRFRRQVVEQLWEDGTGGGRPPIAPARSLYLATSRHIGCFDLTHTKHLAGISVACTSTTSLYQPA